MKNIDALLGWLAARLVEPSTWGSLATFLVLLHLNMPPGLLQGISYLGIGVGTVLGVVLKEKGAVTDPVSSPLLADNRGAGLPA